jgi:histidinol phosphatase-like PHP family hydrolase
MPKTTVPADTVDLHLHAGVERPAALSLAAYVDLAEKTGRRVVGLTDHWWIYLGHSQHTNHYTGSLEGYRAFANECRDMARHIRGMLILWGPEIHYAGLMTDVGKAALTTARPDFFLAEPLSRPHGLTHHEFLTKCVRRTAALRIETGIPGVLAHPLREPLITLSRNSRTELDIHINSAGDINTMFDVDVPALANLLLEYDVPVEINAGCCSIADTIPALRTGLDSFYLTLIDKGVAITLGSDAHNLTAESSTMSPLVERFHPPQSAFRFMERWCSVS